MAPLAKTGQFALTRPIVGIGRMLLSWQARWSTRVNLARLEGHMLDDIGLSARVRDAECAKPFWQD